MYDLTTILVAGFGALGTVTSGLGGYWMAGRNEEARDDRTAKREASARAAALSERLEEQRHDWQRQVLLDLQDQLQKLTRETGRILAHDLNTLRERGGVFRLPEGLGGDDYHAANIAVRKLCSRVLSDDLRSQVDEYLAFCASASLAAAEHKDDPPQALAALIINVQSQMTSQYTDLVDKLGKHIRRELDRKPGE